MDQLRDAELVENPNPHCCVTTCLLAKPKKQPLKQQKKISYLIRF